MRHQIALLPLLVSGQLAMADVPNVVTDIAPVQSLVAMVMQDLGAPAALVPAGASPHDYALRPSQARALSRADVVIWMGPEMTPWLEDVTLALAEDAQQVALLAVDGTMLLPSREAVLFEDDHGHEMDDGHDHAGLDPHAWLDPDNAALWLDAIALVLAETDPDNAARYQENAELARQAVVDASFQATRILAGTSTQPVAMFHDAFQYFEAEFGVNAITAISASDAVKPGPARVAAARDAIRSSGVACVFAEPQVNQRLVQGMIEGTGAQIAILDATGDRLAPGADLYPQLLVSIAQDIAACLGQNG